MVRSHKTAKKHQTLAALMISLKNKETVMRAAKISNTRKSKTFVPWTSFEHKMKSLNNLASK